MASVTLRGSNTIVKQDLNPIEYMLFGPPDEPVIEENKAYYWSCEDTYDYLKKQSWSPACFTEAIKEFKVDGEMFLKLQKVDLATFGINCPSERNRILVHISALAPETIRRRVVLSRGTIEGMMGDVPAINQIVEMAPRTPAHHQKSRFNSGPSTTGTYEDPDEIERRAAAAARLKALMEGRKVAPSAPPRKAPKRANPGMFSMKKHLEKTLSSFDDEDADSRVCA
mmetsp:Transcript_139894/g.243582  ORF Transcript_139894/g.243582 Transcript_139894/m.243582 type:complete len:226 (-) Transcript_139894:1448-2125(-)